LRLERHFQDTWSVRLGGSIHPLPWLSLRSGVYHENGAPPDAYYTVATPDSNKWGVSFGLGFLLSPWEIDVGYLHVFQNSRNISVDQSLAKQTMPNNPTDAVAIGGGRYDSYYNVLGVSLLVALDDLF
jgi:long-subunit fatty acid transport protein